MLIGPHSAGGAGGGSCGDADAGTSRSALRTRIERITPPAFQPTVGPVLSAFAKAPADRRSSTSGGWSDRPEEDRRSVALSYEIERVPKKPVVMAFARPLAAAARTLIGDVAHVIKVEAVRLTHLVGYFADESTLTG